MDKKYTQAELKAYESRFEDTLIKALFQMLINSPDLELKNAWYENDNKPFMSIKIDDVLIKITVKVEAEESGE